jgi:hypothetical protein
MNMDAPIAPQTATAAGSAVNDAGTNAKRVKKASTAGPWSVVQLVDARSMKAKTDALSTSRPRVSHGNRWVTASARRGIIVRGAPCAGAWPGTPAGGPSVRWG